MNQEIVNKLKKPILIGFFVASPGIEPGSGASEALILSIVLRGRGAKLSIIELNEK